MSSGFRFALNVCLRWGITENRFYGEPVSTGLMFIKVMVFNLLTPKAESRLVLVTFWSFHIFEWAHKRQSGFRDDVRRQAVRLFALLSNGSNYPEICFCRDKKTHINLAS